MAEYPNCVFTELTQSARSLPDFQAAEENLFFSHHTEMQKIKMKGYLRTTCYHRWPSWAGISFFPNSAGGTGTRGLLVIIQNLCFPCRNWCVHTMSRSLSILSTWIQRSVLWLPLGPLQSSWRLQQANTVYFSKRDSEAIAMLISSRKKLQNHTRRSLSLRQYTLVPSCVPGQASLGTAALSQFTQFSYFICKLKDLTNQISYKHWENHLILGNFALPGGRLGRFFFFKTGEKVLP